MADELRQMFSRDFLEDYASKLSSLAPLDQDQFLQRVTADDWQNLSLLKRFARLADATVEGLSLPYDQLVDKLIILNETSQGFSYMFLNDIFWRYGLDDLPNSFRGMRVLTTGSSSEFAIRYFLNHDFEATLAFLQELAQSDNEHHRRLASEGTRLRLPWGKNVLELEEHIDQILAILEVLKADSSLYVRKSVANNLNDLSKKYPDLVLERLAAWKGQSAETDWIIKQGLRTLIKEGNDQALNLLDYGGEIVVQSAELVQNPTSPALNDTSIFSYKLVLGEVKAKRLRLMLAMGFQKSKGTISEKRFHLKDLDLKDNLTIAGQKKYVWKDMTTRKHHLGAHYARLLVNGQEVARLDFELINN